MDENIEQRLSEIEAAVGVSAMWKNDFTRADAAWLVVQLREAQRRLAVVNAPDTVVKPSGLNLGMVVMVNGLTGLDACERDAESCFEALFAEEDGGPSPGRIYFSGRPPRKAAVPSPSSSPLQD